MQTWRCSARTVESLRAILAGFPSPSPFSPSCDRIRMLLQRHCSLNAGHSPNNQWTSITRTNEPLLLASVMPRTSCLGFSTRAKTCSGNSADVSGKWCLKAISNSEDRSRPPAVISPLKRNSSRNTSQIVLESHGSVGSSKSFAATPAMPSHKSDGLWVAASAYPTAPTHRPGGERIHVAACV